MKKYNSTTEGTWIEIVQVELTEAEQTLLRSKDPADAAARLELRQRVASESKKPVSEAKSDELSALYESLKPEVKEGDVYQLIAVDVFEKDKLTGIINCRINKEHKQIRF